MGFGKEEVTDKNSFVVQRLKANWNELKLGWVVRK